MFIFLYGENTFGSTQKLKEIINRYKQIHQSGLNFLRLADFDFNYFKDAVETMPMFTEKKLIILDNIFRQKVDDKILEFVKNKKMGEDQDIVIVFFEEDKIDERKALFKFLIEKPNISQNFKVLTEARLFSWAKTEINKRGGDIEDFALTSLIHGIGDDIWLLDKEIDKLISYKFGKKINSDDVSLFISDKIQNNIFKTIEALGVKNRRLALSLIEKHLYQGENEIYLLTMIAYQFRNLIRVIDLLSAKIAPKDIIKKTGIRPFAFQKIVQQAKNFNRIRLEQIYRSILDTEIAIKTGKMEARMALENLIMEIG